VVRVVVRAVRPTLLPDVVQSDVKVTQVGQ
jgi:hypothetical protein